MSGTDSFINKRDVVTALLPAIRHAARPVVMADLLVRRTSLFDSRIPPPLRRRLRAVLESPSQETWDSAHSIVLHSEWGFTLTR